MPSLADYLSPYLAGDGTAAPQFYQRNAEFVQPGSHTFNTQLSPMDELAFRGWLQQNKVPFDPNAAVSDYDMRGFYKGLSQQNPRAVSAIDPNDSRLHYPDYWKTPYHETFSNESQWANPNTAPAWTPDDKLATPGGRVLFDDRNRPQTFGDVLQQLANRPEQP